MLKHNDNPKIVFNKDLGCNVRLLLRFKLTDYCQETRQKLVVLVSSRFGQKDTKTH